MKKLITTLLLSCAVSGISLAQNMENTTVNLGQKAPDLKFANPKGETLELSKIYKDRVVLLDFWASWCRPCRGANPRLVALYDRYKDKDFKAAKKGFTIVSVSLDQNKDAWVKAINDDKLAWDYHMSDLGAWNSKAAELYGIQFIPQAFLVGPDGKVLGKYMTAEQAETDIQKTDEISNTFSKLWLRNSGHDGAFEVIYFAGLFVFATFAHSFSRMAKSMH